MSLWGYNPFGKKVHVPTPEKDPKPQKKTEEVVVLNNIDAVRGILRKNNTNVYKFSNRKMVSPPSLTLNYFLWYITYLGLMVQKKYKISAKPLTDLLDYTHFNSTPPDAQYTRISIGASHKGYDYYITLIDPENDNCVLTAGLTVEHADFRKTAANLSRECSKRKESIFMSINVRNLQYEQHKMKEIISPAILAPTRSEPLRELKESDSDITFTESFSSGEVTPGDTTIAAPKSERARIEKREEIENALPMPKSVRQEVLKVVEETPAVVNNDNAHNASGVVQLDQTLMDPELIEQLNEDPVITSLLEPEKGECNADIIHPNIIIEVEKEVLKEAVKDVVQNHHKKRQLDDAYADDDILNRSFTKKLKREEIRYDARQRTGKLYTGPNSLKNRSSFDYRGQTHDAAGRQINPNRSYRNQDDDFLDYAFYGFIREYGTMVNEIMKLPLGFDYNSQRRGSHVTIKALHFRNTFTHVTGTKASGRMIVFYTELPWTSTSLVFGRTWNEVKTEDILEKSVTMYAGDLEELEAADVFYNPTIMSQYNFKNVILGNKFTVLYDYYADLNTQAVKGVVGEDVESVDSIKTKWVKIDDLELPLFYEGEDNLPMRGMLGVLFMGDYFGGEIETNMTLRVFYNSH